VLIALVIASGAAAPTPLENMIIVPTTETTLKVPVAETRRNSAAPNTAVPLVTRSRAVSRTLEASRLAVKLPIAAHAAESDRSANSINERKRHVLDFILFASSVCGLEAEGPVQSSHCEGNGPGHYEIY